MPVFPSSDYRQKRTVCGGRTKPIPVFIFHPQTAVKQGAQCLLFRSSNRSSSDLRGMWGEQAGNDDEPDCGAQAVSEVLAARAFQECPQLPRTRRMAELAEGFRFDLPDA